MAVKISVFKIKTHGLRILSSEDGGERNLYLLSPSQPTMFPRDDDNTKRGTGEVAVCIFGMAQEVQSAFGIPGSQLLAE